MSNGQTKSWNCCEVELNVLFTLSRIAERILWSLQHFATLLVCEGSLSIRNKRLPLFLGPDRANQRLKWSFINFAKNWPFMFSYGMHMSPLVHTQLPRERVPCVRPPTLCFPFQWTWGLRPVSAKSSTSAQLRYSVGCSYARRKQHPSKRISLPSKMRQDNTGIP